MLIFDISKQLATFLKDTKVKQNDFLPQITILKAIPTWFFVFIELATIFF